MAVESGAQVTNLRQQEWKTLKYAYNQSSDNGIDMILYRGTPPNIRDLVIVEVKQNLSSGGFAMSTGAKYGDQMSERWIKYCAKEFKENANSELLLLAKKVEDLVLKDQYSKAGVSFRDQIVGSASTGNKELILINLAK